MIGSSSRSFGWSPTRGTVISQCSTTARPCLKRCALRCGFVSRLFLLLSLQTEVVAAILASALSQKLWVAYGVRLASVRILPGPLWNLGAFNFRLWAAFATTKRFPLEALWCFGLTARTRWVFGTCLARFEGLVFLAEAVKLTLSALLALLIASLKSLVPSKATLALVPVQPPLEPTS